MASEWKRVSFAADCDGYDEETGELGDICSICGLEYCDECECPGPTEDGFEYREIAGFLFARRLADSIGEGLQGQPGNGYDGNQPGRLDTLAVGSVAAGGAVGGLANPERDDRRPDQPQRGPEGRAADGRACGGAGSGGMGDSDSGRLCECGKRDGGPIGSELEAPRGADAGRSGPWHDSYWLLCRDGKHRRVPTEPALFPLADGLPYKLARRGSVRPALLKGAGNAIVPQVASEFIAAYLETLTP